MAVAARAEESWVLLDHSDRRGPAHRVAPDRLDVKPVYHVMLI